ncbi:potassium-transporting ATPase subunit C [Saccharomonospora sp. NPDC046836]|uniref:potassium-transporting ATPase subunit C n=1 Tax=Saccharomonospora sp. NPDC046836 TaxID=3156921 RepID=UPI0034046AB8
MKTLAAQTWAGVRILLVLTVIVGILYPLATWAVSRLPGLRSNAEGSVVTVDGRAAGSGLIGVDPVAADPSHDPWFHTRPSASASQPLGQGDPSTSGGSNKGAADPGLVATVRQRQEAIARREGVAPGQVPPDAVTASGSGVDPGISPPYADLQVPRVARENRLPEDLVRRLVADNTTGRGLEVLGEPAVNVLRLNLAVQAAATGRPAP